MVRSLFLIGKHGTGKTTIGQYLAAKYGWTHISVGDLCRQARRNRGLSTMPLRLMAELAKTTPGVPLSMEVARQLCQTIGKINQTGMVVCDGFPSAPEHLDLLPPNSDVVWIQCQEVERERRLETRAAETARRWTPGRQTLRDDQVEAVYQCASLDRVRADIKARIVVNDGSIERALEACQPVQAMICQQSDEKKPPSAP
jgi:adenylate kinase family enzyme